MLITLEGAPAVGKSTIAKQLSLTYGYVRIPEVNELFPNRPASEPTYWYCDRQLDRCNLAARIENGVYDGDLFQPIWFAWLYPNRGHMRWVETAEYFIKNHLSIKMPSFYAYLQIDEGERYRREQLREKKRGHTHERFLNKWARYKNFPGPQSALFKAMHEAFPGWVHLFESSSIFRLASELVSIETSAPPNAEYFIEWLIAWLDRNHAADFY